MTAFVVGLALLFGPPSPVLHSQGAQVTPGRGSYCWAGEPDANGLEPHICADTFAPPPLSDLPLPVRRGGRVRVDTVTEADALNATLRGRRGELRVVRTAGSKRRFTVELPRRLGAEPILDLRADYPKGDGAFGAQLRTKPRSGPPRPLLRAGHARLVMARGSYCWSSPPVGICADTGPPVTKRALTVRHATVRVDMRMRVDVLAAAIRGGPRDLPVLAIEGSRRRFRVLLPRDIGPHPVLDLFARYPQGDSSFGARLRLR